MASPPSGTGAAVTESVSTSTTELWSQLAWCAVIENFALVTARAVATAA